MSKKKTGRRSGEEAADIIVSERQLGADRSVSLPLFDVRIKRVKYY